jgi:hypothetical protein
LSAPDAGTGGSYHVTTTTTANGIGTDASQSFMLTLTRRPLKERSPHVDYHFPAALALG